MAHDNLLLLLLLLVRMLSLVADLLLLSDVCLLFCLSRAIALLEAHHVGYGGATSFIGRELCAHISCKVYTTSALVRG